MAGSSSITTIRWFDIAFFLPSPSGRGAGGEGFRVGTCTAEPLTPTPLPEGEGLVESLLRNHNPFRLRLHAQGLADHRTEGSLRVRRITLGLFRNVLQPLGVELADLLLDSLALGGHVLHI